MINDELLTSLEKEKKVNDSFIHYDDAYRAERHDRGNVAAAAAAAAV